MTKSNPHAWIDDGGPLVLFGLPTAETTYYRRMCRRCKEWVYTTHTRGGQRKGIICRACDRRFKTDLAGQDAALWEVSNS